MIKIGIAGAENSHCTAIAKTINIDRKVPGVSVSMVWGETREFAENAAEKGGIPVIADTPSDMQGKVNAAIVDHRDARYHVKTALMFVEAGIPVFIDKPLSNDPEEAESFLSAARKQGVPVTSFSTVPLQKSFKAFLSKKDQIGRVMRGAVFGPCDMKSKYGGVIFYGIHQVELAMNAFGSDIVSVQTVKKGAEGSTNLFYRSGLLVTLNLIGREWCSFGVAAHGTEGTCSKEITSDKDMYLAGIRRFVRMFKTGKEPVSHDELLKTVKVLSALKRSVRSGKKERVT